AHPAAGAPFSRTRPPTPAGVMEYFLPQKLTLSEAAEATGSVLPAESHQAGIVYRPVLLAQAAVHFGRREYNLNTVVRRAAILPRPEARALADWEGQAAVPLDPGQLDRQPLPEATYASLEGGLNDGRLLGDLEGDFEEWVYRNTAVALRAIPELDLYAGPDVSKAEFARQLEAVVTAAREEEAEAIVEALERKIEALNRKVEREERELGEDEEEHSRRKREEMASHAELLIGLLGGRRRSVSRSMSKRSMTSRALEDIEESKEEIEQLKEEMAELQEEHADELAELVLHWEQVAENVETMEVEPYKKDIAVELFGVAWLPHYVVEAGDQRLELAAYGTEVRPESG
ncbi:MAG: hypothetical protein ACRDHL_03910, partial [Candidatus Promineifilaceae bacterium]